MQKSIAYLEKIIINFQEKLKDSVTYTLNFRQAVTDMNENNPLKNFQFSFATGSVIDSLQLSGTVKQAFDLKSEAEQIVMIYRMLLGEKILNVLKVKLLGIVRNYNQLLYQKVQNI